jgi:signal transduction histidine kinase
LFKFHPAVSPHMTISWPGGVAAAPAVRPGDSAEAARTIDCLAHQLRTMAAEVGTAEARERDRIACRLHDDLGQQIVLVRLKLGEVRAAEAQEIPALLEELSRLVAQTCAAVRSATFDLAEPAWDGGLFGALEALGSNLAQRAGLEVRVDAPPRSLHLAEPKLGVVCRVVRELCHNVHKHAHARTVRIATTVVADCLRVSLQDDGHGLPCPVPARWTAHRGGGFGLASAQAQLRAFGGELAVSSRTGAGTCATLVMPLHDDPGQLLGRLA